MSSEPTVLDVRTIDGPPFGAIMSELDALETGDRLLLISEFEPQPLYNLLTQRGFEYDTEQANDAEWHVEITPASDPT